MKKVSTLLAVVTTADAAPAAHDFVVDSNVAKLSLQVFNAGGTAPTIALSVVEMIDKGFTLDYDAQTANFTAGRTLVGVNSNARALIMDDTDGGATGTLELKKVVGNFQDNEPLREEISGVETSGAAVANGTLTRVLAAGEEWAAIPAGAVDAEAEFINPDRVAGEAGRYEVYPRRFRLTTTKGGTWTDVSFAVDLISSGVDR
jgi:hypothetical protein